jgi:hypothetical protein
VIAYLRSLDCEDIRDGRDDLIPPTFEQLVADQGQLTESVTKNLEKSEKNVLALPLNTQHHDRPPDLFCLM